MVEALIDVEVAYAAPEVQCLLRLSVPAGSTVAQALMHRDVLDALAGLDISGAQVGIFARVIARPAEHLLHSGDRIEIYRPLLADPKEVRRLRAARALASRDENKPG